jgi:4-aminobutyrate aminotransferase-like enzyme
MDNSADEHLSPVWKRYTDILVDRAQGAYLWGDDGRRYLDFSTGIGVTNTGHCHPKVVAAIHEQAGKLIHGQVNIVHHRPLLDLVSELLQVVPAHLDAFFFGNSGAEAVEASLKLARHATGRPNVIVFQGSFHGRTVGTMSLTTSNTIYRVGYQPLMAGVFVAPYPYAYHYGWSADDTAAFCLRELQHLLATQTAPQAKGLASGLPLSGIAARAELMARWIPGTHGGTYGGNAIACASAVATVRAIREEGLVENSARMGAQLLAQIREIAGQFPVLGDVRGLGLMVATEFSSPSGEPDAERAKAVWQQCLDDGLLLLTCGTYGNVIRWIPPLIVTRAHLHEALDIFQRAMERVAAR